MPSEEDFGLPEPPGSCQGGHDIGDEPGCIPLPPLCQYYFGTYEYESDPCSVRMDPGVGANDGDLSSIYVTQNGWRLSSNRRTHQNSDHYYLRYLIDGSQRCDLGTCRGGPLQNCFWLAGNSITGSINSNAQPLTQRNHDGTPYSGPVCDSQMCGVSPPGSNCDPTLPACDLPSFTLRLPTESYVDYILLQVVACKFLDTRPGRSNPSSPHHFALQHRSVGSPGRATASRFPPAQTAGFTTRGTGSK